MAKCTEFMDRCDVTQSLVRAKTNQKRARAKSFCFVLFEPDRRPSGSWVLGLGTCDL